MISNNKYFASNNIHPDPKNNFAINPDIWIEAEKNGKIQAIVHSHPGGKFIMSEADMLAQQSTKVDWIIVKNKNIYYYRFTKPLLGRKFIHGKSDCYSLIRDAYMLCSGSQELPHYNRNDGWWNTSENLYFDNIKKHSKKIETNKINFGDIILFTVGCRKPNHAAIYTDNNMILHHYAGRLSCRDFLKGYWLKYMHSAWRFEKWQYLDFTAISNNMALNSKLMQAVHQNC